MSVLGTIADFATRRLAPLLSPLHHRRHRRALLRGRPSTAAVQQARASWWGGDPRWYPGGTPPRRHNRVTPLVDGDRFLGELFTALHSARHYVYVAGWCLTPELPLRRGTPQELVETRLLEVLRTTAARVPVRILLWAGSRAVLHPSPADMERVVRVFARQAPDNLTCRLDHTAHFSHCHHQKAIVVDGQLAFVGGMDLTTLTGDRWDVPGHPLRAGPNWHDIQVKLEGEVVADVEQNFRQRWQGSCPNRAPQAAGDLPNQRAPVLDPKWETLAQVVRTIPHAVYATMPRGEFGIRHAYLSALRHAQRFIYLENQYLWSPEVMDVLVEQLQRPHVGPFRIVIVLPAGAHSGKWDNDQHVRKLRANAAIMDKADRGDRPLVCSVHGYQTGSFPASWFLDEGEVLTFEH